MLTHEQTTIRLRDAEISRLRQENERLIALNKRITHAGAEILRECAKYLSFSQKVEMQKMADELEKID